MSQIMNPSSPAIPREVGHATVNRRSVFWLIEAFVVLVFLLLFSEGLLGRVFASPQNPEGGVFLRLLWLPVYAFTLCALAANARSVWAIIIRSPFLVLLGLMAIASFAWSIDPSTSLRRGIAIFFTTGFGLYLAARYNWRELLTLLGLAWLILGVGSFIAAAAVPSFGVMHEIHVGAWQGLWFEKNQLGGHMARASFLFGFLVMMDPGRRRLWIGALLLAVLLVLMSTSKTSLLGMMLGFAVLGAGLWMKRGAVSAIALVWSGVASIGFLVFLLVAAPDALVAVIGRDLTLTGRTDIWEALFMLIDERPLLGYGYGAFWGEDSTPAFRVRQFTEWDVPTAHNGLIEITLALGKLGAVCFLIDYLTNLFRGLRQASSRASGLFAVGFLVLFALFSVSESVVMQQNNIIWVMYAAFAGRLALDASNRSRSCAGQSGVALNGGGRRSVSGLRGRLER